MEALEGGFEITTRSRCRTRRWPSLPQRLPRRPLALRAHAAYGGPKVDEEKLFVTGATASADRKKVTLQVAGLRPGHVVHIRWPRPFADAKGEQLWNTEAWYTLNAIPGYEKLAERASTRPRRRRCSARAGRHRAQRLLGLGLRGQLLRRGAGVRFEVERRRGGHPAGAPALRQRPVHGLPLNKRASLYVNNVKVETLTFPGGPDWKTWLNLTRDLPLVKGTNLITIRHDAGDDGRVNLDALKVGGGPDHCAPAQLEPG